MKKCGMSLLFLIIFLLFHQNKLNAIDFTYNIDVDTVLQKAKTFETIITNTEVQLYGMVLNHKSPGPSKVATVTFGLTHIGGPTGFTLLVDSIYVRVLKFTRSGTYELYSRVDMSPISLVSISPRDTYTYETSSKYPHTDNAGATYRVQIRIFGSYE